MTGSGPDDEQRLTVRLLRAALERLTAAPADQLSLRQVAQDVGVSHQAPYVHFGSRRGFLAAVAGEGMAQATERARAMVEAAGDHPHTDCTLSRTPTLPSFASSHTSMT